MGVVVSPESAYYKELHRWDRDATGWNPNDPRNEYPCMLYRAFRRPDGIVATRDAEDEAFNRRCQMVVNSPQEKENALRQGWSVGPAEAREYFINVVERAVSDAAAHRNYEDRNMSEAAKREAAEFDGESPLHVAEIPEKPKGARFKKAEEYHEDKSKES